MTIRELHANEVFDSRGTPTVEAVVVLENGCTASATVPSGASTGTFEALELRDGDAARYNGKGVLRACANVVNVIAPALRGTPVTQQEEIDRRLCELDGTADKSHLGANAILAVSLACARAGALSEHAPLYRYLRTLFGKDGSALTLPRPMLNVINGGRHADNGLDFQEYMILPQAPAFAQRMRIAAEVSLQIGALLREQRRSTLVGDEGGFAPPFASNRAPLDLLVAAVHRTPYMLGADIAFGLDVAASEFFSPASQRYERTLDAQQDTADALIAYYEALVNAYPIATLEDGLGEEDWEGWAVLTKRLGSRLLLIGDDLFVTNRTRLQRGIDAGVANAVVVKVNQIGTLTETFEAIRLAQEHKYRIVVSHRSGETNDDFIADLAVAVDAPFIKAGAMARSERLAKYNRLLRIEQELG